MRFYSAGPSILHSSQIQSSPLRFDSAPNNKGEGKPEEKRNKRIELIKRFKRLFSLKKLRIIFIGSYRKIEKF